MRPYVWKFPPKIEILKSVAHQTHRSIYKWQSLDTSYTTELLIS